MSRLRVLAALAFLASLLVPVAASQGSTVTARPDGSYSETKTITRVHLKADGTEQVVFENEVTVTADHTRDLRGRERIHVSWAGARPSGGRASDPYGEGGLTQEYPVVILQCRGRDDASLPEAKQLRPETCWTTTSLQRSAVVPHRTAVWRYDRYEPAADRAERSGVTPFPEAECEVPSTAIFSARITPFVAANGETFLACDAEHMPPEAALDASFPPAEIAAFTNEDGSGEVDFEVRSDVENESLGCSDKVVCSLVVIPIMGISCGDADAECRRNGTFLPGSSNFDGSEPHPAVSPRFWWSESNWRNRFSIPLDFGLPPDACDVLDPRPPVGFYGSELLSQAALQWSPAYCLNKRRFKFQHNRMPEAAGFSLMAAGGAVAALVSGRQPQRVQEPIGYAPTAVTGFGIGYVIDKPDNAGEYERLRLNARLLAKLLTQSYPGSALGRGHPGLGENPLSINQDPEFKRLNPGLDERDREAAATLLSLSNSSDVIEALTEYIASDPDAMKFVNGKTDPWGMRVNPTYKSIELPRREWPLLDEFKPEAQPGTCRYENNDTPYLSQIAAPVSSLRTIADALIDSWPNVQTTCEGPLAGGIFRTGRVARQPFGQRFMLGIISLGDAARFGVDTAALETKSGAFVAPTEASLSRAVALTEPRKKYQPFAFSQDAVRKSRQAYPGMMIVYTASRLTGLAADEAELVASFIRIATSEGQVRGRANGDLPEGFLPIRDSGVTKPLFESAREVAAAVQSQDPVAEPPDDSEEPDEPNGPPAAAPGAPDLPVPDDGPPSTGPSPSSDPSAPPTAIDMPATVPVDSGFAGGLLPLLLALGVGCVVATSLRAVLLVARRRR